MKGHVPAIREYDWTIGPRWRWDCSCRDGGGGYTNRKAAQSAFDAHVRGREMWAEHLREREEQEKSR